MSTLRTVVALVAYCVASFRCGQLGGNWVFLWLLLTPLYLHVVGPPPGWHRRRR